MQNYDNIRRQVLDSSCWLAEHGHLGHLSGGGNISVGVPGEKKVAITPSGRSYLSFAMPEN